MSRNDHQAFVFALLVLVCAFSFGGLGYPTDEVLQEVKPIDAPLTDVHPLEDPPHPRGCFHFYVTQNMSSLLADATKMLQQVRNRHEREWIMTFIYRIKSLAEHLRTHPDSQNYHCLSGEEEDSGGKDSIHDLRTPQQELYFVDDANHAQKRAHHLDYDEQKSSEEVKSDEFPDDSSEERHEYSSYSDPRSDDEDGNHNTELSTDHDTQSFGSQDAARQVTAHNLISSSPPDKIQSNTWREESMSETGSNDKTPEKAPNPTGEDDRHESYYHSEEDHLDHSEEDHTEEDPDDWMHNGPPLLKGERYPYERGIVLSSPPDCESNRACDEILKRQYVAGSSSVDNREDLIVQHYYSPQFEEWIRNRMLKERIRKALLEQMINDIKKLRTVGGSEKDLLDLWEQSRIELEKSKGSDHDDDFDYEESGAAAGELHSNDRNGDPAVAPSTGEVKNRQSNRESGSTKPYEPEDDSDVLVKQLFDVRYERNPRNPTQTTVPINRKKNEYLITSTPFPY